MRATLSFDLAKEEDQTEFRDAYEGTKLRIALWEYDRWLRDQIKYQNRNELQPARDKLYEILEDQTLSIDD